MDPTDMPFTGVKIQVHHPTPRLLVHHQQQQDALRHSWDGRVAGTDGSVDERTEVMGAGYVLGADPLPIISFFTRVGGPLASARAEAASLLQLQRDVRQRYSNQVHLLIFVDCLVVLDIIRKWGQGGGAFRCNLSSPARIASVARKGDTG
jgi:hypothetical protein